MIERDEETAVRELRVGVQVARTQHRTGRNPGLAQLASAIDRIALRTPLREGVMTCHADQCGVLRRIVRGHCDVALRFTRAIHAVYTRLGIVESSGLGNAPV